MTRWLLLLVVAGCSYRVESLGNPRFTSWRKRPHTALTPRDAAARLGPPHTIRQRDGQLWFFYVFREVVQTDFVLSYYLNIFRLSDIVGDEADLVLIFGSDDRLLYTSISEP